MSWSVGGSGKAGEVLAAIERQFETSGPCMEPEETVRQAARGAIKAALEAQGSDVTVNMNAYGSQGKMNDSVMNSLNITISASQ